MVQNIENTKNERNETKADTRIADNFITYWIEIYIIYAYRRHLVNGSHHVAIAILLEWKKTTMQKFY